MVAGKFGNVLLIASVALIALATSTYATGLINYQNVTPTTGVISSQELGVYKDRQCTQNLTSISWGTLHPAGNAVAHMYIRNLGNLNLTLTNELSNWNPLAASNYLAVNWNYTGQVIKPSSVLHLAFTLTVSPNITNISTFKFNINIIAQG
ncbi:MAG: hypothetical protein QG670_736 [Thermoproteota archaeon]|nr:hypothetical protein [Thermoproteota archaeon]